MTPNSWLILVAFLLILSLALVGRRAYELFCCSKDKRIRLESQRHMLRFCKHPTRQNWKNAWDFLVDNDVMLCELDWPLVERFTKTAVSINFPPEEQTV